MSVYLPVKALCKGTKVIQCDEIDGGETLLSEASKLSKMNTVPQVFIGGQLIGGCVIVAVNTLDALIRLPLGPPIHIMCIYV